jgi:hypothetical protein
LPEAARACGASGVDGHVAAERHNTQVNHFGSITLVCSWDASAASASRSLPRGWR